MRPDKAMQCMGFPCSDVQKDLYCLPDIEIDPKTIRTVMVSEAAAPSLADNFYSKGKPFFLKTTLKAFSDAGYEIESISDMIRLGVYVTTAVKCGKVGYSASLETIKTCANLILENELSLFPNVRACLLMGDVAIRAFNSIAKRNTGRNLIPSGPTYKIRKAHYEYDGKRVFPSYLQTGKSYLIEKSKQKMIAEDIKSALAYSG